jgi:hypothetical protein
MSRAVKMSTRSASVLQEDWELDVTRQRSPPNVEIFCRMSGRP